MSGCFGGKNSIQFSKQVKETCWAYIRMSSGSLLALEYISREKKGYTKYTPTAKETVARQRSSIWKRRQASLVFDLRLILVWPITPKVNQNNRRSSYSAVNWPLQRIAESDDKAAWMSLERQILLMFRGTLHKFKTGATLCESDMSKIETFCPQSWLVSRWMKSRQQSNQISYYYEWVPPTTLYNLETTRYVCLQNTWTENGRESYELIISLIKEMFL